MSNTNAPETTGPIALTLSPRAHLALRHLVRDDPAKQAALVEQLLCARMTRIWGDRTALDRPLEIVRRLYEALLSLPLLAWSSATGERFHHLALAYEAAELGQSIRALLDEVGQATPTAATDSGPAAQAWGVCEEPVASGQICGAQVPLADDPRAINRCPVCGSLAVRESAERRERTVRTLIARSDIRN